VYAVALAAWFGVRERIGRVGFYSLFAVVVTLSVQLVGVYLVFASLIIPALATQRQRGGRLITAYACGLAGYALGLALSVRFDLPSGAAIVWALAAVGVVVYAWANKAGLGKASRSATAARP
jgi:zinc/manganese transport system permease protein